MRDFQRIQQKNPHASFRRCSPYRRWVWRVCTAVTVVVVYVAITMPPLRFLSLTVHATTEEGKIAATAVIEQYLNERSWWLFPHRSLLIFRRSLLAARLANKLPIASTDLEPLYRARHIDVVVRYRLPAARIQLPSSPVFVDNQGCVLDRILEPYREQDLLSIQSTTTRTLPPNTEVVTPNALGLYRALRDHLQNTATPVVWMILSDDPDGLHFQMKGDWTLRIPLIEEPAHLITRLDTFFLEYAQQENRRGLEYVDLRFGDKVVYKEKGAPSP